MNRRACSSIIARSRGTRLRFPVRKSGTPPVRLPLAPLVQVLAAIGKFARFASRSGVRPTVTVALTTAAETGVASPGLSHTFPMN